MENKQIFNQLGNEVPIFSLSAITSHLADLGMSENTIKSIERCGQTTGNFIVRSCDCTTITIPTSYSCNQRACQKCSQRRRKRIIKDYLPYLTDYLKQKSNLYSLRFLTISPENYDNLEQGLDHVKKSFSKFIRRKYLKERIKGGIYVIECKNLNKDGISKGWNIHIHAIIFSRYLDNRIRGKCLDCGQSLLKYDYNSKLYYCSNKKCNSTNVIHKSHSKLQNEAIDSFKRPCSVNLQLQNATIGTLSYLCKYVSINKDSFNSEQDFAMYVVKTQNKLLISKFGEFYSIKVEKKIYTCLHCGSQVHFDYVMLDLLNANSTNPPPNSPLGIRLQHNVVLLEQSLKVA